jgi:hypothetical protein
LLKDSIFVENVHDPHSRCRPGHVRTPGGGIGNVNLAADVLDVERNKPRWQMRVDERAGREAQRREGAVENINAAGPGVICGIEPDLRCVMARPV